jgi:hypothetical protein
MGAEGSYPERVEEILRAHGDMVIANPMTGEAAKLTEALPQCVDKETGHNHLVGMLAEMSVEEAGVVLQSFAPEE